MPPLHRTFNGDGTLINPVRFPSDGAEGISVRDVMARNGETRNTDPPSELHVTLGQVLDVRPGHPVLTDPVGFDSRPATQPAHAWTQSDRWGQRIAPRDPGLHAEYAPAVHQPVGEAQPFRRSPNTWRSQPEPWDAAVLVGLPDEQR